MTLQHLVDRERRRLRVAYTAAGLALSLAVSIGIVSFGALLLGQARWLTLPRAMPFGVWLLVGAADVAIGLLTWQRLRRASGRHTVAAQIEREQALRAGSLRGALEIGDSGSLGRHAAERMAGALAQAGSRLAPRVQQRARRRALAGGAAALLAALLLGWIAPVFDDGLLALLLPVRAWQGTLLPRPEFRNLPPAIVRGEQLQLLVVAPRRTTIRVTQRSPGEAWTTADLPVSRRDGIARATIGPVMGDLIVVASDGRTASDTAVVRVTDRPFVGAVSMRAVYPAYLGRAAEGLPVGEPARVPQGTRIEISGRASTQLSAILLRNEKQNVELHPDGHAFSGTLEARQSGHWTWAANGVIGPIADVPLPLDLEVVPDSAPRIDIVSPKSDTIVATDDRVMMQLAATDDHGLASVDVESWREQAGGQRQPSVTQRLVSAQSTVWSGIAAVDLATRGLQAGDVLHVKAIAVDNSPWAQRGESRELLLKIPTMEERRAQARAAADSTVRAVTATAAAEKSLEQRTSEVARERERSSSTSGTSSNASGGDKAMSYEAAERSRAVAKEQQALLDKVRNLQQQAAQLSQQLKQAGAMDSSLARELREAQALLQQALTPDLLAQMQKLDDATRQLSGNDARQALKDLAAMQQRLREQLEKSAEMLKRAAYEGAMQTLHDEAKEIADRERKLADSAAAMSRDAQQARSQQLGDRADRLSKDMQALQQRLEKDRAELGATRADSARQHARNSADELHGQSDQSRDPAITQQKDSSPAGQTAAQRKASGPEGQKGGQPQAGQKGQNPGQQNQSGQSGQNAGQQNRSGQSGQNAGQQNQSGQSGQNAGLEQRAERAASEMDRAAAAMQSARDAQVQAWKQELTGELDRAVQELLEMSRQESALEQKARSGSAKNDELRGQQSAVSEGVQKTSQQLQQQAQKTSLLSNRSQRAMSEAGQKVAQAMQALGDQRGGNEAGNSLGEAADALNRAAASLARDREKANSATSASGFAEMLQQMQELAKKQGGINAQAQGLLPMPGGQMSPGMQATARALARQQQQIAQQLDDLGESAGGDRAAQMAREARQLAEALEQGRVDAGTLARQQQLFRRLLDAGRSLEKDEREDNGKREAQSANNPDLYNPTSTTSSGKSGSKFREPSWNELRGLTPDERRAILEYFKRINGQP